jgi:glucose/galactose transporter
VKTAQAALGAQATALAIIGLLFFVFGFVTWLNGSLIPFLKVVCQLTTFEALLVTFAFYIAYAVMALPMAMILARTGYRRGMALGLLVMAGGALLHIPAALSQRYGLFLAGLFTLGTGLTILQAASNPYIVLLGPVESAARRISLMGIVNKGAGVAVPLLFSALVLGKLGDPAALARSAVTAADRAALAQRLVAPYAVMAVVLLGLVLLVARAPLPEVQPETPAHPEAKGGLLAHPRLWLGALALFAYVGVEVLAGDTIGLFGAALGLAGFARLTAYTMGAMVLGYLLGIALIPRLVPQRAALVGCGLAGLVLTLGVLVTNTASTMLAHALWGWAGVPELPDPVACLALLGLANALVWPTIWPLAIDGLGRHTARGSALLIMAITGGTVVPLAYGWLARSGAQQAYWLALPCYAVILAYALAWPALRPRTR